MVCGGIADCTLAMSDWMRKVLESKRATLQRLWTLSFSEKLKLLEKLRVRSLEIARGPLRGRQRHKSDRHVQKTGGDTAPSTRWCWSLRVGQPLRCSRSFSNLGRHSQVWHTAPVKLAMTCREWLGTKC